MVKDLLRSEHRPRAIDEVEKAPKLKGVAEGDGERLAFLRI
jgi:hypothetical protein